MNNPPSPQIPALIQRAVEVETARILDEEIKGIAARVEKRVRGMTGQIAAQVLSNFSMESLGHSLRITVKFETPEER